MGLSVSRLTAWLTAIMRRVETTHPETNWNLMIALGEVMSFPSLIAPDNDDQSDRSCAADDPGGVES
jgi:hypothetical protein